ncbi:MAG: glycosyltransferase family 4 protein [Actinobacteria bacterium]|nr:glycosyltransferase family 4 protein [Actinomycetota bacterium]
MRIAIDATILTRENTGTGFYIINLINGLKRISDKKNEYYIFISKNLVGDIVDISGDNFHVINVDFKPRFFRVIWQFIFFPFTLKRYKIDILHSPNYITPLFKFGFKIIVTIHDLTFCLMPSKYTIIKRLFYKSLVPLFMNIADKVISVSENTKKDIISLFKVREDKIYVTYESYPEYYNTSSDSEKIRKILSKYGIEKKFILFVGMLEPRKNILSLLKAFYLIDDEIDMDLIIVGKKGWYYTDIEEFIEFIKTEKLKNEVKITGYVAEPDLKYFYQGAFVFAYPSLYEGFGLPPLQAIACGTPVITSNVSSLPEVVDDAAIKIDPLNIQDLADAIKEIVSNDNLRNKMKEVGIKQASKFSLDNFAINTLKVYEN